MTTSFERIGNAYVPVIVHNDRIAPYTRSTRFLRKARATEQEAVEYAQRRIEFTQRRKVK